MIVQFEFRDNPDADCILIRMFWDGDRRAGQLVIPDRLNDVIAGESLPPADEVSSIDGALGYGLFLSARSGLALHFGGDQSVWPQQWGVVLHSH